jgi:hypothetical protein
MLNSCKALDCDTRPHIKLHTSDTSRWNIHEVLGSILTRHSLNISKILAQTRYSANNPVINPHNYGNIGAPGSGWRHFDSEIASGRVFSGLWAAFQGL